MKRYKERGRNTCALSTDCVKVDLGSDVNARGSRSVHWAGRHSWWFPKLELKSWEQRIKRKTKWSTSPRAHPVYRRQAQIYQHPLWLVQDEFLSCTCFIVHHNICMLCGEGCELFLGQVLVVEYYIYSNQRRYTNHSTGRGQRYQNFTRINPWPTTSPD